MSNKDGTNPVAPSPFTQLASTPVADHGQQDDEVALLRETISKLLSTIKAQAGEKNRIDALAMLIRQLQDANEHLVLAAFGAQDLQSIAEAASQRQIEFLSMLAHELRNPLQPMAMANNLLADITDLHPTIARVHGINGRQITHMVRLVDDLLDASRVSNGKITLLRTPILLSDVISIARETSQAGIDRRHQQLTIRLPVAPVTIFGDLVRLAQVFSNLLINASKFTQEHGHIEIVARRVGDMVEVTVSDNGAGVPVDIQPYIFDLFTQGFRSLERAQGGLGIGLSLVRTITQLHGGSSRVSSEGAGMGSKFIITLPLCKVAVAVDPAAESEAPVRPCRILLIEDNIDANDVLTLLLQHDGHTVTSCFNGPTGLRAGLDQPYDIVLCDIGLPGMDGYQVVSALRAALPAPLPRFVATTGYSAGNQSERATEAGFDHYLIKPISMPALVNIIRKHRLPPARDGLAP